VELLDNEYTDPMTKPGSPNTYRDELAAAQGRVASLEEQLAVHEQSDEHQDEDEDGDPVITPLLEQRQALERTASGRSQKHWWLVGPLALTPVVCVGILALTLDRLNTSRMGILTMVCGALGLVLAMGLDWVFRKGALQALPQHDVKIAEARRLRAIERGLRARPAGNGPRVRLTRNDEAVEEEGADEAAPAPRARQKR
jgi:hypothetical protein